MNDDIRKLKKCELKEFTKIYKKEKNISKMKKPELVEYCVYLMGNGKPKKLKKINKNMEGYGLFENVKKGFNRVANIFKTPQREYHAVSRNSLNKYGNWQIIKMTLGRTPVMGVLEKFLNVLSLGKYNKGKEQTQYDKLFHLFSILELVNPQDKTQIVKLVIEKNAFVNISTKLPKFTNETEFSEVPIRKPLLLGNMMENTINKVGTKRFFVYDGLTNNCQRFLMDFMESNGLNNVKNREFILQNIEAIAKSMPNYAKKVMKIATNLGNTVEKAIGGKKNILIDENIFE